MPPRFVTTALGAFLVFVSVVAIMTAALPGPLRPVDYFLCGAVGTLVALTAFFITVVRLSKARDVLYKTRRRKPVD